MNKRPSRGSSLILRLMENVMFNNITVQMSQIPLPGFEANTPEEMIQAMERGEDILQDEIDFRNQLLNN